MMDILVDRFVSDNDATISKVNVDRGFVCFGLEDEYRETKVANETRIPAGNYPVRMRREGDFHNRYAIRFQDIHRGMLHIQNVPNFEFILIHCGNTDEDTAGCLLVGSLALTQPGQMAVTQSTEAYRRLYLMVRDAAANGNLNIRFEDNDRR
jgi:hypothetical protein